jgi:hypothetical protein
MLTNLARYNAPGIKDNKKVSGKRNQRDRHQMADECDKKRDKIQHATQGKTAKNDGKDKGRNISRTTGINIIEYNNTKIITNSIPSIITVNITNHVKRNITSTNKENKQARKSR